MLHFLNPQQQGDVRGFYISKLNATGACGMQLTQKLDAVADPRMKDPFLRQGEMLLAKHKLYGLCFEELCHVADSHDGKFGQVTTHAPRPTPRTHTTHTHPLVRAARTIPWNALKLLA